MVGVWVDSYRKAARPICIKLMQQYTRAALYTGKTILLRHIAQAVAANHPEMHLIVLLSMSDRKK
jgi:hypothetical protein